MVIAETPKHDWKRFASFVTPKSVHSAIAGLSGLGAVTLGAWDTVLALSEPGHQVVPSGILVVLGLVLLGVYALQEQQLDIGRRVSAMQSVVSAKSIDAVKLEFSAVKPDFFREVVRESFEGIYRNLGDLLNHKSLTLYDQQKFASVYRRFLDALPGETIRATALPTKTYFWGNPGVAEAIARFVARGGTMKRLFFLERDSLDKPETREILDRQAKAGVEVYTILRENVSNELNGFWLVADKMPIAWEARIDGVREAIISVVITADDDEVQQLRGKLDRLFDDQPGLTRYQPSTMT